MSSIVKPVSDEKEAKRNAFSFTNEFKREFDCAIKAYEEMFSEFNKVTSSTTIDIQDEYGICNNSYKLRFISHKLDIILPEIIENYDLTNYDYIIASNDFIDSTIIKNFGADKKPLSKEMCIYADFEGKPINNFDKTPAFISCQAPYEYIFLKGFFPLDKPEFRTYTLLKNQMRDDEKDS